MNASVFLYVIAALRKGNVGAPVKVGITSTLAARLCGIEGL
jgi:hypothetical protein